MKLEHFLTPYTKINSKWIKDLNIRPETIKLLWENIGRTIDDINQGKILYDAPPRVMEINRKVNEWDLIKLKSFCTAKKTKQGEKTTLRMGENNSKWNNWQRINFQNIQAAHTTQYQKNNPIKKWEKDSDISPKKTSRWLTNAWKDAQHHSLSEKWGFSGHWWDGLVFPSL